MKFEIETADSDLPIALLGIHDPVVGTTAQILDDGSQLEYRGRTSRKGMLPGLGEVFEFVLTVASGTASGVLAAWLYGKLKGKAESVKIDDTSVNVNLKGIQAVIVNIFNMEATDLVSRAKALSQEGQPNAAEKLFRRGLEIREREFGPDDPQVADVLNKMSVFFQSQNRTAEAATACTRALRMRKESLQAADPHVAESLNNLATLRLGLGQLERAEELLTEALEISRRALGEQHPLTGGVLSNLAKTYSEQKRDSEAEPLFRRAIGVLESTHGENHPNVARVLDNYVVLLRRLNRVEDARQLEARSAEIKRRSPS